MDLSKMRTPDWILGGCALVLIVDLLFFPWHKVDIDLGPFGGGSYKRTGIQSPNAFWGILALLLAIAILAVVIVRRLTTAKLPDLPISWTDATFYGAIATLALLVLKLIIETDALGFGSTSRSCSAREWSTARSRPSRQIARRLRVHLLPSSNRLFDRQRPALVAGRCAFRR